MNIKIIFLSIKKIHENTNKCQFYNQSVLLGFMWWQNQKSLFWTWLIIVTHFRPTIVQMFSMVATTVVLFHIYICAMSLYINCIFSLTVFLYIKCACFHDITLHIFCPHIVVRLKLHFIAQSTCMYTNIHTRFSSKNALHLIHSVVLWWHVYSFYCTHNCICIQMSKNYKL